MAGSRPARPCTATAKSTGKRCRCYAITGGTVCRLHGGAAPQVKYRALLRRTAASADAAYSNAMERLHRETLAFQVDRIVTTSRLLGIPVAQVTTGDIVWCHAQ